MERAVISEAELVFMRSGKRVRGTIRILQPYVVDDAESRCEIEITAPGVLERRHAISGSDTLQALLLAVRFLATTLIHYRDRGLRLLHVEGGEWQFEAYFGAFGLELPAAPMTTIWIRTSGRRKRAKRRPPRRPAA